MDNEEQDRFIKHDVCDMSLRGIPGGGKTRSIIEKVIYLKSIGYITKAHNFLILTFTNNAQKDFLKKGKIRNNKLFTKSNVRTIHSLSGTIMSSLFNNKSSNLATIVAGLLNILEKDESLDISKLQCLRHCKIIFVDEAQDISDVQHRMIMKISEKIDCRIIMVGDPNQNIYQFQGGSAKHLMEHSSTNIQLKYNYRSTKSIVAFLNHFRPWKAESEPMISHRQDIGEKPIIYCGGLQYLIQRVHDELRKTEIPLEDIAIIGPVKKGNFNPCAYNLNIGLQIFAEYFHKENIPHVAHYVLSDDDTTKRDKEKKPAHVNLYTIHGSKGLEFKKIFLLNFHYTTMGRVPNLKTYNEHKYLWFTGLSRPKDELSILVEQGKTPWLGLDDCPKDLYQLKYENKEYKKSKKFFKKLKETPPPQEEDEQIKNISVTKLLEHRLLTEDKQLKLEKLIDAKIETFALFDRATNEIMEVSEFSALYGIYMENIFTYHYLLNRSSQQLDKFIYTFKCRNDHNVLLPSFLHSSFLKLKDKYGEITLCILNNNLRHLNDEGRAILVHLSRIPNIHEDQPINLQKTNGVSSFDQAYFYRNWENLKNNISVCKSLFNICLYFFQIEHECMHLLTKDFSSHLTSLEPYIGKVIDYARKSPCEYQFQVKNKHPHLPIYGIADIKCNSKLIDLKFTKAFRPEYIYQLLLYYNNVYPKWNIPPQLEIMNLFTGENTVISISSTLTNRDLNYFLCHTFNIKMERNIIVYDLETTGLDTKTCEIIERYMYDMSLNYVLSEGLIIPSAPIAPNISYLTGITDKLIAEHGEPRINFEREMNRILNYYYKPTFIAHNGKIFDHKILKRCRILNDNDHNFLDSKIIIHNNSEEQLWKLDLEELYIHIVGRDENKTTHRAKDDTIMILEIFDKLRIDENNIKSSIDVIQSSDN